jgi:PIN domain nuclease of toxin-antitoxin system
MTKARRLLLDTQTFLWWKTDAVRLTEAARAAIAEADVVFVSAASAWEVAIKGRLGRITLDADFAGGVADSGFEKLLILFEHAAETRNLPDHHRDPFDRMLIAQARVEGLALLTHDRQLEPYDVELFWT